MRLGEGVVGTGVTLELDDDNHEDEDEDDEAEVDVLVDVELLTVAEVDDVVDVTSTVSGKVKGIWDRREDMDDAIAGSFQYGLIEQADTGSVLVVDESVPEHPL